MRLGKVFYVFAALLCSVLLWVVYFVGSASSARHVDTLYANVASRNMRNIHSKEKIDEMWTKSVKKFNTYFKKTGDVEAVRNRNLVVYHVEDIDSSDSSLDVTLNNIKVFVISIHHNNGRRLDSKGPDAFYVFNVEGGLANPAISLIPHELPNVGIVQWTYSTSAFSSLKEFGGEISKHVGAVFSLSSGVRGPLVGFEGAAWIGAYRKLLDRNNVGIVGPWIDCEPVVRMPTHTLGIRSALVDLLLGELKKYYHNNRAQSVSEYLGERLAGLVKSVNFKLASMLAFSRLQQEFFNGECIRPVDATNIAATCNILPSETYFVRWGGDALSAGDYFCGKGLAVNPITQRVVTEHTQALAIAPLPSDSPLPASLRPSLPEVTIGGLMYDLYAEQLVEHQRGVTTYGKPYPTVGKLPAPDSQVCFLVRTAKMHDPNYVSPKVGRFPYVEMHLETLARSLIMQTNPNWQAYFIITDPSPFERRLEEILLSFNDPRLVYFDVDLAHRPVFTAVDAGYTTTDFVLDELKRRPECKWITATNGDNAYGSEVVDRILNAQPMQDSNRQPDMLLIPMDSRNVVDQEVVYREDFFAHRKCVGIEALTAMNQLAAAVKPLAKVGRLDLATLILNRQKLNSENIRFSNFSDPTRYQCKGCNDGYFTQYLVRNRGWSYARLPVDGLRSLMFHGPSPTHCIAAGNVWFDHTSVGSVGCLSHETVRKIMMFDAKKDAKSQNFDWAHYNSSPQICLRLSKHGYDNHDKVTMEQRRLSIAPPPPAVTTFSTSLAFDAPLSRRRLSNQAAAHCKWEHYLKLNPDIAKNITLAQAPQHYDTIGFLEDRECKFHWKKYLKFNQDLIAAGITTEEACISHYVNYGKKEGRQHTVLEGFDWTAYLEANQDLVRVGVRKEPDATGHYKHDGRKESRFAKVIFPTPQSYEEAVRKFETYYGTSQIPHVRRNLIVYYIDDVGFYENALELTANNVKVFVAALLHHVAAGASAEQDAFYWFNVAGIEENVMRSLLPAHLPNVAVVDWTWSSSAVNAFLQTMKLLEPKVVNTVSAVFSFSSGMRGPLLEYENAAWLSTYRKLLDFRAVGMVGPVISCEESPHVQVHAFALRSVFIPKAVKEMDNYKKIALFVPVEDYFRHRLSAIVTESNHYIASLLHAKRLNAARHTDKCINFKENIAQNSCDIAPEEVLFMRWTGETLSAKDFVCGKGIAMTEKAKGVVEALTAKLFQAPLRGGKSLPATLRPVLPEALSGWPIYAEFNAESGARARSKALVAVTELEQPSSKVCFLVQVDKAHDGVKHPANDMYERAYVQGLIQSLMAQTNTNWKAFLYTNEQSHVKGGSSFESDLNALAATFNKKFVSFLSTTKSPALSQVLKHPECKWITAASGDNFYGSEVVDRTLRAQPLETSHAQPDLLLAPTDSKFFAVADSVRRKETQWRQRCTAIEGMVNQYQATYTVQPLPKTGHYLQASVFYQREKLVPEGIADVHDLSPQYLVRTRGWTYARLAMDGLRSTVFDGSSPTYCIASGNVWLDHACSDQSGCLSHQTVLSLHARKSESGNYPVFDWTRFYSRDQVCLRLSESKFKVQKCAA